MVHCVEYEPDEAAHLLQALALEVKGVPLDAAQSRETALRLEVIARGLRCWLGATQSDGPGVGVSPIPGPTPATPPEPATLRGDRPDWDTYFADIAAAVAARADCTRARHGAVIVDRDHRIVSTGYNGAPSAAPGCATAGACARGQLDYDQLPPLAGDYDQCVAVHAEANAVIYAGRDRTRGATVYVTGEPCAGCRKLLAAAAVDRVVWPGGEWIPWSSPLSSAHTGSRP